MRDTINEVVTKNGGEFTHMATVGAAAVAEQVKQIEDMINSGVDGLIIGTLDGQAVLPVFEMARDAGIPIVMVDNPPAPNHPKDTYITCIGTDNYAGAVKAGETMIKALGGTDACKGKKVVVVRGENGSEGGDLRASGFTDTVKMAGIEVVAEQPGNWNNSDALVAMENMLSANPDISGFYSCSDVMIDGALQAVANNPNVKAEHLIVVSFDGSKLACDLIKKGTLHADMAQNPKVMGAESARIILSVLNGESKIEDYEKYIDSGCTVVTKENVDIYYPDAF
jgi:ribose transport system substrate-binding protein